MKELLSSAYKKCSSERITEISKSRHLCAKSLLPPFVTRMITVMNITAADTFIDLGCGNGSILFQVAFMTGARCIGIELLPQNAELAREAWGALKPVLELHAGRDMPDVEIITGDLCQLISTPWFQACPNLKILTSNLLFPKQITHFMSERFRSLPLGAKILCFDDLYPHSRTVAQIRDPEAFELFDMKDYVWTQHSVEWTIHEGHFFVHTRK
jgi:cyclopropane fatty-acyl-phospholipid synthase-like methyltransferase